MISLLLVASSLNATEPKAQDIEKLKVEKQALELKLEAYKLQKEIVVLEEFLKKKKEEKEEIKRREEALRKLKHQLRVNRKNVKRLRTAYAG